MRHEQPPSDIIRETRRIAVGTALCLGCMFAVSALIGRLTPAFVLGGLVGSAYAVLNFYLLGRGVQRALDSGDEQMARSSLRASYSMRMVGMLIVAVLAFVLPFVEGIACLIALVFPRITIFVLQLTGKDKT